MKQRNKVDYVPQLLDQTAREQQEFSKPKPNPIFQPKRKKFKSNKKS